MRTSWKRSKNKAIEHPYLTINLFFGLAFVSVIVYAVAFPPEIAGHPIPCVYTSFTGQECSGCGLSRGFSHIVRFDLQAARTVNPYSIPVFMFFALQILLRIAGSIVYLKSRLPDRMVFITDGILTGVLFLAAILPLYAAR